MNEDIKKRIIGVITLSLMCATVLALVIKIGPVAHKRENPTHRVVVAQIPDRPIQPDINLTVEKPSTRLPKNSRISKPMIVLPPLAQVIHKTPYHVMAHATKKQPRHINHAWLVQLGSFKNKQHAKNLLMQLKVHGFKPYIKRAGKVWQVVIGPEFKKADAEQLIQQIDKKLKIKGIIKRPLKINM